MFPLNFQTGAPTKSYTFCNLTFNTDTNERVFAFAVVDRDMPRVFEYMPDQDGLAALSNLIRAETVIAVIRGRKEHFVVSSVVNIGNGDDYMEDRMVVKG